MTFMEFLDQFPTEKKIVEHFLANRYPDGVQCNHCGSDKVYRRTGNTKVLDCAKCRNTFSPFKWFCQVKFLPHILNEKPATSFERGPVFLI